MHEMGIIHRDLKPENIFITLDNSLKIGDLGISRAIDERSLAKTRIGTPRYVSPEVLGSKFWPRFSYKLLEFLDFGAKIPINFEPLSSD